MAEWEVRLEGVMQLGKSASHSRITETISLQETGGMFRKSDRHAHAHTHICTQTHIRIHSQASGRIPVEVGRVLEGCLCCNRLIQELSPRRLHYRVWPQAIMCVSACMCAHI